MTVSQGRGEGTGSAVLTQATIVTQSSTSALLRIPNLEMHRSTTKTVARPTKTALVMSTRSDRSTSCCAMLGHGRDGRWAGQVVVVVGEVWITQE